MKIYKIRYSLAAVLLAVLAASPAAVLAQTRVNMPKNKYKVQDDVKLGREVSAQVEQKFPIISDPSIDNYVERVGERLVASIPQQFQQPAFDYEFDVVNARDINAFALPGGPMYVNRGMIEAARNEGEMAGVMAHEISHVALRHATAQQTKVSNPLNQILGIGAVLGGAILGGQAGAQLGQIFAQGYFLRYSRDYETQADILGAQILANAGYDPRDLANMFQTISGQSGSRNPEWLSSHPDPGNRFQNINREAARLRVSSTPIKVTRDFSRVREQLSSMPRAQSLEEIQRSGRNYGSGGGAVANPIAGGRYSARVAAPSGRTRTYSAASALSLDIPDNWRDFPADSMILLAPEGAYGDQGITHGAMIGVVKANSGFQQALQEYINSVLQANDYLRQTSGFTRTSIGGRSGYMTELSGRSPVTGRNELVTVYALQLRSGDLFYLDTVVPEDESYRYESAFRNMVSSIRINDR